MCVHLCKSIFLTGINKEGTVAGGEDFDIRTARTAYSSHEGHESAWCEIRCERLMNVFESSRKILCDAEAGSCVCVAHCRE